MRWGCLGITYWVEFGVACCLMRLSVIYDKYAIQSRKRKMWLLSFRKITVKSYSVENLNMSREEERKASGSEAAGRGQCFPCLFSKFESAGDSFIMRKTTTAWWLFSVFTPWEDRHGGIVDTDAFPCIWSLGFSETRCACALSVPDSFLRVRLWCLKKMQHEIELVLCGRFAHISTAAVIKQAQADVYQTIGCVFLSRLLFV